MGTEKKRPDYITDNEFYVIVKDVKIALKEDINKVVDILGSPISVENSYISDDGKFVSNYYTWEEAVFEEVNGKVNSIIVKKKGIETARGLSVGDSIDELKEKFKENYIYQNTVIFIETENGGQIEYLIEENRIVQIYINPYN
jgi:hypothetical protein